MIPLNPLAWALAVSWLGWGGQTRVHHLSDAHCHGIVLVLSHVYMESLQTSVGKETVKGTWDTARCWENKSAEIEGQNINKIFANICTAIELELSKQSAAVELITVGNSFSNTHKNFFT